MRKKLFLVSYTIKQMADILGVHPDTLRNWEREGLLVPHRINKRGDRRYTDEHIREVRDKGLIPNPQIQAAKRDEDYEGYSKEQLISELKNLKKEKRFGVVWEEGEEEEVVKRCKKDAPILARQAEKRVFTGESAPTSVFIEGDNYHALQMLNYTHREQIDVIYIDPPYNTGAGDWMYNNKYIDENDRFRHSKWLNMMQARLKLAKDLLSQRGVIICTIDHYELFYLGALMDEAFGEENRLGIISVVIKEGGRNLAKMFSVTNEFYLIYAKNKDSVALSDVVIDDDVLRQFNLTDERGSYRLGKFIRDFDPDATRLTQPNRWYPIYVSGDLKDITLQRQEGYHEIFPISSTNREMVWNTLPETFLENLRANEIVAVESNGQVSIMRKIRATQIFKTHWTGRKYDAVAYGTKLLKSILGRGKFDYPKSLHAVLDALKITSQKNSIILDFFAGSGTTGHAVLELNKQDGGNRKFILCTNNENYNGNGSGGIAEAVCYPRIKKVMEGYQKHGNGDDDGNGNGNGENVAGLGGNLEYFKTDFVDVENINNVPDAKKLEFTHKAGELLALKESCFNEVERNEYYQIFTDGAGKFTGVYFRGTMEKLKELDKKLLDKPDVRMYIFSYNNDYAFQARYAEYPNVGIENIPEPILRVYQEVNL